jgi:hypothetical protein
VRRDRDDSEAQTGGYVSSLLSRDRAGKAYSGPPRQGSRLFAGKSSQRPFLHPKRNRNAYHGLQKSHRKVIEDIPDDLSTLSTERAVQILLSTLNGEQNLRSALNRATREKNIPVVTSSDEKYLYVWRADSPKTRRAIE